MMEVNVILHGDALTRLKELPDNSVHCCVTSPPYWGLRDYGVIGQLGMEKTPEEYISNMVAVFREVKRVLRNDGTLWVNIGDSYWGGKGKSAQAWSTEHTDRETINGNQHQISGKGQTRPSDGKHKSIKPKDLVGIPWMLAFALRSDGWYLRQDIIWSKPNPMPESVTDRCTKSHEYIFMLSKSSKYYYDAEAIKTEAKESTIKRLSQDIDNQKGSTRVPGKTNGNMKAVIKTDKQRGHSRKHAGFNERWDNMSSTEQMSMGANKRSVWEVATKPFSEAHFATFPEELIVDCIKAGCPIDETILDPFFGAGTTGLVARKLGRNYIGIELNEKYIKEIAEPRLKRELGMFQ